MAELDAPDLPLRIFLFTEWGDWARLHLPMNCTTMMSSGNLKVVLVFVTQDYKIKDLLKKIIKSFIRHRPEHKLDMWDDKDDVDLLHKLKAKLSIDRYLAVIDDNVDKYCFVHQLNFLGQVDSWKLFLSREKSSSNRDRLGIPKAKRSAHLDNLGMQMVDKCQGLPLVIVELTKLLMRNQNYQEWVKIKEHIWRELKDNSVEINLYAYFTLELLPLEFADELASSEPGSTI
ncbi:hypothetical protein AgCh_035174 [Apium graveolens]